MPLLIHKVSKQLLVHMIKVLMEVKKSKVTPFSTPNYSIGWVNWVLRMALMYKTAFY